MVWWVEQGKWDWSTGNIVHNNTLGPSGPAGPTSPYGRKTQRWNGDRQNEKEEGEKGCRTAEDSKTDHNDLFNPPSSSLSAGSRKFLSVVCNFCQRTQPIGSLSECSSSDKPQTADFSIKSWDDYIKYIFLLLRVIESRWIHQKIKIPTTKGKTDGHYFSAVVNTYKSCNAQLMNSQRPHISIELWI